MVSPRRFCLEAVALEARIFTFGIAALTGRGRAPAGYAYAGNQPAVFALWTAPLLLLPEMVLLDVLLRNAPAARLVSDALHVYLSIWAIGVIASLRAHPHRVANGTADLRLGPFMRAAIPLEAIASVAVRTAPFDRATLRALRADRALFALPLGDRFVEIALTAPVEVERRLHGPRRVARLLLSVDDPQALAAALRAS
jgi:hypothetical protein